MHSSFVAPTGSFFVIRSLLIAFSLSLASVPAAFAAKHWVEVGENVIVAPFNLPADAVEEMDVVDAAGRKIGEVEEVIGPRETEATALAIDFEDNAGLGEEDVIVPLAGVQLQGDRLLLTGDAKTIKGYEIYAD
jgi:sporulation protein YlmC with PRC-barrel domain